MLSAVSQSQAVNFEKYKQDQAKKREYACEEAHARAGCLSGTYVKMWEQLEIELYPGEHGQKTIFTDDLRGAIALALIAKYKSGMRRVMLSNYPPMSIDEQAKNFLKFIRHLDEQDDHVKHANLLMVLSDETGQASYINQLKCIVNIEPTICFYSRDIIEGQRRTFQVQLDASKVTWRLFSDGYVEHEITH